MKINKKLLAFSIFYLIPFFINAVCCSGTGCCTSCTNNSTYCSNCNTSTCCNLCCSCNCDTCCNTCNSDCCLSCYDCCGKTDCTQCCKTCNDGDFCYYGRTWFSQRDQGTNQFLSMEFTNETRHKEHKDKSFYSDLSVTLGWQQNFDRYRLSSYFLTKCGTVTVGANAADGTTAVSDIRASDLGLSTTFTGTAWLCPKYQDLLVDFDWYFSWERLWVELEIPFVHTRWNSGLGSSVTSSGGTTYAFETLDEDDPWIDAVDTDGFAVDVVYTGDYALSSALLGNCTFGDAPRLNAGKMINCRRTANGLANIKLELGFDFIRNERGALGLGFYTGLPLANQPNKKNSCDLFIFEPKVGSQHEFKLGALLHGQYKLWKNEKKDECIEMFFDGRVGGILTGKSTRLLGLQANNTTLFNQYLLLKKYSIEGGTGTYVGLERAANMLRAYVEAKPSIEGQLTFMFNYQNEGIVGGFGYNFFGRGEEKLGFVNRCCCDNSHYYVIKGDLPVKQNDGNDAGFYGPDDSNINQTGTPAGTDSIWNTVSSATIQDKAIRFTDNFINSDCCNISNCNGATTLCVAAHPRYLSHTIFGNFGYHWYEKKLKPFIGLIAKVELGQDNTALRLWGAYIKGGLLF